jgi:hypothetical protein
MAGEIVAWRRSVLSAVRCLLSMSALCSLLSAVFLCRLLSAVFCFLSACCLVSPACCLKYLLSDVCQILIHVTCKLSTVCCFMPDTYLLLLEMFRGLTQLTTAQAYAPEPRARLRRKMDGKFRGALPV